MIGGEEMARKRGEKRPPLAGSRRQPQGMRGVPEDIAGTIGGRQSGRAPKPLRVSVEGLRMRRGFGRRLGSDL